MKEKNGFLSAMEFWFEPVAFVIAVFVIVASLNNCAGAEQSAEDARKDAACAATRTLFDEAQTRVLEASCLDYPSADACPSHMALTEAFVLSLKRLECETAP